MPTEVKKKMGRPQEIDYMGLLYDLYRYRTLSVDQIKSLYFKGKENSVYVILHRMKKEGLVESTCRVRKDGKKIAACYYITGKGITQIREGGFVENPRRAYDNKPEGKKIPYLIDTNELYVQLHEDGFEMIDARDWKSRFEMDRNSLVKAGLKTPDGREYGVYIFEQDVNEDKTLQRFKNELKNNPQAGRFFIFFRGKSAFTKLFKQMNEVEFSYEEVNLIPFSFGVNVLKKLTTQKQFVNLFTNYGEVKINDHSNTITSHFSEYTLTKGGEEYYVCNYLLRNEVARHYLRYYSTDRYQRDGRKVLLFTWESTEKNLNSIEEDFKQYPHIQVIKI